MKKPVLKCFFGGELILAWICCALLIPTVFGQQGPKNPTAEDTDQIIIKFRSESGKWLMAPRPNRMSALSALAGKSLSHQRVMSGDAHVLRLPSRAKIADVAAMAKRLMSDPDVEYAEPDRMVFPTAVPNDPMYTNQWHYKAPGDEVGGANLPGAWAITTGAASVVVAVLDTGIRTHEDISSARILPGYDMVTNISKANDGDARDSDPSDPGDWVTSAESSTVGGPFEGCAVKNSSWHGTHVTGTIGASTNNGIGVAGINWNSKILPVRVLGKCGGYSSDSSDGIRWAAGLIVTNVPNNLNPAKVINMSLGGSGACGVTQQAAIDNAVSAGATIIVSAGNDNVDASGQQPANCNGVITIAATNYVGGKASYSNFGSAVKIAAPGGGSGNYVLSTSNTGLTTPLADTYAYKQGTSQAAPHVSGIVSLMLSANPSLTPAQILSILTATARVFPTGTGSDCTTATCGAGIVNAAAALEYIVPQSPATIYRIPSSMSFSGQQGGSNPSSQNLSIANTGGGTLNWSVSDDATWLSLSPTSGSSTGETDSVTALVNTSGLGAGSYNATITISASGATNTPQTTAVTLTVSSSGDAWDPTDDTSGNGTWIYPTTSMAQHGPHTLSDTDLADWFRINMTAGYTYHFDSICSAVCSATAMKNGKGDVTGQLYSDSGGFNLVKSGDDEAGNYQFAFDYTAANTQTYYLKIRTYGAGDIWGGYLNYSYTAPPAPTIASITPSIGLNNIGVNVNITNLAGTGFVSGATVKLTKSGEEINATNVVRVSAVKITCTFPIIEALAGLWNVVVTNPDMQSASLVNGFTIMPSPATLSWTDEINYVSDGLDPETGTSTTTFVYRVKYTNTNNTAPASGYPKVHIRKGVNEISGSPAAMNYVSGNSSTGAIYTYSQILSTGTDFTYYFEANDADNNPAGGPPISTVDAPDVSLADMYEIDNDSTNAKIIISGIPQAHSIVPATDTDWVKFTLSGISDVTLETSGPSGSDTRLWLYNSSLGQIGYNDDIGGGNYFSRVSSAGIIAGTYYAKVDEYHNDHQVPWYYITLTIFPATVLHPQFLQIYATSATVTWDAVAGADYTVVLASNSLYTNIVSSATETENSKIFSGLSAGTAYWLEVKLSTETNTAFTLNRISTTTPSPATLSWTGEMNYTFDGLDPEMGTSTMTFVYRVKYMNANNMGPASDYPKVHIKKAGTEISGSPFLMDYVSGDYTAGAIYSYSRNLDTWVNDYTYNFEAYDSDGNNAIGESTSTINAPDVYDGAWSSAGSMSSAREYHTATLLPNGKVLVIGGWDGGYLSSAEIYYPNTSSWLSAGLMSSTRYDHTATLLPNGKVLVTGGYSNNGTLSSAEIYDPSTNTWSSAGSMSSSRLYHTATLLSDGKVLVTGGYGNSSTLSSAEIYDPNTNTWLSAGSMSSARRYHTATLLPDGKVLVTGGYGSSYLSSAELYDPNTNTWSNAALMSSTRKEHTATLLSDGKVLVTGGYGSGYLPSAEIYDPNTNTWLSAGSMLSARECHTATLLPDGKALVTGGGGLLSSAEIYNPNTNTWSSAGSMSSTRRYHTATLLPDGKVLVTGGTGSGYLSSTELFSYYPIVLTSLNPAFAQVNFSSLTVTWASIPGADYTLALSSDANFMNVMSSATQSGNTKTFTSLLVTTRYYFEVKLSTEVEWAYVGNSISTITPLTPPANITGYALGVSSVAWNWDPVASATGYRVYYLGGLIGSPAGASYAQAGLNPNTTSFIQVAAVNGAGASALTPGTTVYTLAKPPSGSNITAVSSYSATMTWNPNGNPGTTNFELSYSSVNFASAVSTAALTTASSKTLIGLLSGTTYYFRVRAYNGDNIATNFDSVISSITLPVPPANVGGYALGVSSVAWSWDPVASATGYRVYYLGGLIGSPAGASYAQTGLNPNATSFIQVAAVNGAGASALTPGTTVYTLAKPPSGSNITAVSSYSATMTWNPNGNPGTTNFELSYSSVNFASAVSTAALTTASSKTLIGLLSGTTYYFRVRAYNGDNIAANFDSVISSITLPVPPANVGGYALGVSSVAWSWDPVASATGYRVYYLGSLIGSPAGASYAQAGLNPNATSFIQVAAVNGAGASALTPGTTVYTLAKPPSGSNITAVSSYSVTMAWNTNGNPGITNFELSYSSVNFASAVSTAALTTASTRTLTGLLSGTTYYFRVRAYNGDNIAANFDNVISSITLPVPPANVGGYALGVSSVAWSWDPVASATGYRVYYLGSLIGSPAGASYAQAGLNPNTTSFIQVAAVNGAGASALAPSTTVYTLAKPPSGSNITAVSSYSATMTWNPNGNPGTTNFELSYSSVNFASAVSTAALTTASTRTLTGLLSGTTYYFRVRAYNGDNIAANFDNVISSITLPVPPANITGYALGISSVAWSWDPVASATGYRVYYLGGLIGSPAGASYAQTGLNPNATSFIQVAAVNGAGTSALTPGTTVYTLANAPTVVSAGALSRTIISISWNTAGNSPQTIYEVGYSSDPSSNWQTISTRTVTYALTNLLYGTTYYTRVRAFNGVNIATQYTDGNDAATLSGPAVASVSGVSSGSEMRLTIRGNNFYAGDKVRLEKVGWQNTIADPDTTAINPDHLEIITTVDLLGLATGVWNVVVYDNDGVNSGDSGDNLLTVSPFLLGDGITQVLLDNTITSIIAIPGSIEQIIVSSGLIPNGFVLVSTNPEVNPIAVSSADIRAAVQALPYGYRVISPREYVAYSNSVLVSTFAEPITFIISYPDNNPDDGIIDGTNIQESDLKLVMLDNATVRWVDVPAGEYLINAVNNIVTAHRTHFSVYALAGVSVMSNISQLRVYPIPWKPGAGGKFDSANINGCGHGLIFDNLPTDGNIRIYNYQGDLIKELNITTSNNGCKVWDGRNTFGQNVASGVYIAIVKHGSETKSIKIAVLK